MSLFQVKTGRERPRKNEKKLSFQSVPTLSGIENQKKNSKKIQKIQKYHYDFISSQTGSGEAKKEREKKLTF